MKILSEEQQNAYNLCLEFLTKELEFDCETEKIVIKKSADNSIICKGKLAGYSIVTIKRFVALVQEKQIEYID